MLSLLLALLPSVGDIHDRARELLDDGDAAGTVELLTDHLQRSGEDTEAAALYGEALLALERRDESAHWLAKAVKVYTSQGARRELKGAETLLKKADPLARTRSSVVNRMVKELTTAAEKLEEKGQPERALKLFQLLQPIAAEPKELGEINAALERIKSSSQAVDLDASGGNHDAAGSWPVLTVDTEHYNLVCALEPEIVEQLAVTVEDLFDGFVGIYFDGDLARAPKRRVTIYIHGTWEDMAEHYTGGAPSPGVQGWWSPGQAEIHAYDARTRGGSLDSTLETLLHEGSHQFMSTFARGGTPAWINEGTACFFEGSRVMVDGRVLWPDAARGRLLALATDLGARPRRGPRAREVISYPGPGSYPGNYYHHGWGLAYFLQQWEHPETLEYSYRDRYLELIERYTARDGGQSLSIFEEVVLGPDSPLGHTDLEAFLADWERWILEEVLPLHQGLPADRRERRMARAKQYLDAAATAGERGSPVTVPPEDLLLRALGDLETVRGDLDAQAPRRDVLESLADVLERLDRERTAAAILDELLAAIDAGEIEVTEEELETLGRRMQELDRGNWSLSTVRRKQRTHARKLRALVEDYRKRYPDLVLRAYTLAALGAELFEDTSGLSSQAQELREEAKQAGRLLGRVVSVDGPSSAWKTVFSVRPRSFSSRRGAVSLECVRPLGMIDTSVPIRGEYEVRGRLIRGEERHLGTAHGLVVAGDTDQDWTMVGIDEDGQLGVWAARRVAEGSASFRFVETLALGAPVAEEASPDLVVRVRTDGTMQITVDGQPPVETEVSQSPTGDTHVGVFARDGNLRVEGLTVEIFP